MGMPMETWPQRHRITVDEYYRMAELGLLAPDARVELIEGEIIDMAPIGSPHGSVVDQLNYLLTHAVGDRAIVRVQGAVRLSQITEPLPDVALLKPRTDFYRHRQPTAADTLLLIEVSESTLRYDREVKLPLYARLGVPEVWIIDLEHDRLLFYRSPTGGEYVLQTSAERPGITPVPGLSDVAIDLSRLLSP
jgi:Uma2 family endonuclease